MTSRGHVTSKAPMAVRDQPVKSYSFHTQSSLISLVLNRLLTDKDTEDKEQHFFHVRTRRKSQARGGFDCKDSDLEDERWSTLQRRSFSAWEANFCAGTARDWDIGLVSIIILTDDIAPSLFRRARGGVWEEVVIINYRAEAIFIALSGFRAF